MINLELEKISDYYLIKVNSIVIGRAVKTDIFRFQPLSESLLLAFSPSLLETIAKELRKLTNEENYHA